MASDYSKIQTPAIDMGLAKSYCKNTADAVAGRSSHIDDSRSISKVTDVNTQLEGPEVGGKPSFIAEASKKGK